MPILGLTGGVATGKSTLSRGLLQQLPAVFFDSDECVHDLLATDAGVCEEITQAFGQEVLAPNGTPDRLLLRERVFGNQAERRQLESILHPRVEARWKSITEETRRTGGWALIDIPLLYETKAAEHFDRIIVVACSRETQLQRMIHERGLDSSIAMQIIAAQLDLGIKIQKADHLIWNDSTVLNLDGQTRHLASCLRHHFA